jgi:hypothetical protein
MYILFRNESGGMVDGVLLAAGPNVVRVVMQGSADTLELRLSDGSWSTDGEKFGLEALLAETDGAMSSLGDGLRMKTLTAGMRVSD